MHRGATTIVSLHPMPSPHRSTAPAVQPRGRALWNARIAAYSAPRKHSAIIPSVRCVTYVTVSVCRG